MNAQITSSSSLESTKKSLKEKRRGSPRNLAAASRISAKYMRSRDAPAPAAKETPTTQSASNSLNALHREVLAVMLLPYRRDHYGRGPLHMAAELGHMVSELVSVCVCVCMCI